MSTGIVTECFIKVGLEVGCEWLVWSFKIVYLLMHSTTILQEKTLRARFKGFKIRRTSY